MIRRVQISTDRQVFETIRASDENILQDAIYGPESNSTPHLFFHWQQRQEQEAQDRFGHFSFLTPAVEEKAGSESVAVQTDDAFPKFGHGFVPEEKEKENAESVPLAVQPEIGGFAPKEKEKVLAI